MKGIVVDIKNNKAVILNKNADFIYIANKNYKIGQQIKYKQNKYKRISYIAACIVLFMFASLTGYAQYYTPVSHVSLDINTSSIQLSVNRFSRVIEVKPLNRDAEKILDKVKVENRDLNKSIDKIIDESKSMGYLSTENNNIQIDIATKRNKLIENVSKNLNKYKEEGISIDVEKTNKNELELSKQLNTSVGRMKAISEYTNTFGGDIKENAEKLSDLSVGDIKKRIREKRNNESGILFNRQKDITDSGENTGNDKLQRTNENISSEKDKDLKIKRITVKQRCFEADKLSERNREIEKQERKKKNFQANEREERKKRKDEERKSRREMRGK